MTVAGWDPPLRALMSDLITLEEDAVSPSGGPSTAPVVIEARGISKTFQIPEQKVDTLKERVTHPLRRPTYRELRALHDVSFDVHKGEFFGIVGRNGSGKSTLLKIMSSIYRADSGTLRMAGRVAPFIELGVGFNPELTSIENCELNGVLMGLSRAEARRRTDAILDFGELREFNDLKVKNYSSGMMVRLAFSIMVQADADVMLIDEVLAVGDASFTQKCMDVFHERRRSGKTIVLVTHDMSTVHSLCHRAMALHDGELQHIGDPEKTAMHYYRLNFTSEEEAIVEESAYPPEREAVRDLNARLVRARLLDKDEHTVRNIEEGQPIILDAVFEAARDLTDPIFVLQIRSSNHVVVWGASWKMTELAARGRNIRLKGSIENRFVPGSYVLECWIRRDRKTGDMAVQGVRLASFVIYGTGSRHGIVKLDSHIEPTLEAPR